MARPQTPVTKRNIQDQTQEVLNGNQEQQKNFQEKDGKIIVDPSVKKKTKKDIEQLVGVEKIFNQGNHAGRVQLIRMHERVEVFLENDKIAETIHAIKLLEGDLDPVIYIPKNDLTNIDLIRCGNYESPNKGHAEVYTIKHRGHELDYAAWSYDQPQTSLQELMGHVAFFPEQVEEIRITNLQ